jgi:hypothetical protein
MNGFRGKDHCITRTLPADRQPSCNWKVQTAARTPGKTLDARALPLQAENVHGS